ncbi:MAG: MMPL family transporter, partial [Frankiaceae bacterium]
MPIRLARVLTGRRTKYAVLVFWIAVMAIAARLSSKLTGAEKNDAQAWLPGSAESTQVLNLQKSFRSSNTLPAVVVYSRTGGITGADRAAAAADARSFAALTGVGGPAVGPLPSKDGQALETVVPFDLGSDGWKKAKTVVDQMRGIAADGSGLTVHITGPLGSAADSASAFEGIDGTLLYATVAVVVVILLLTYRSPILWLLPVMSAGIALTTAEAVIYLLAKNGLTVNAQSAGILTVLVFGAGTDYALLLIARYREELRQHEDRHEAIAVALHRAGPALIASAATVAVSMLCLLAAESNPTRGLGPVAAIGIVVGLFVMISLLPALLVICGRWLFWPVRPGYGTPEPTSTGVWARVGQRIARRPRTVWVGTAAVLAVLSLGILQLDASGLTNKEGFRSTPDSTVGAEILARHFPAGAGSPVLVLGNAPAAGQLRSAFAGTPGIDAVSAPAVRGGVAYLEGTLTAPPDSHAAFATVDSVRDRIHAVPGAAAKVGGDTAINLDVQRASRHDRNLLIPIVLLVVLLILAALLRAVIAAVVLLATVVLSYATALGVSALIFRHVFGYQGADSSFPLFVFVFLVALGIDYNIFLMTRVR